MNTFKDQGTQSGEDEMAALQHHAEQIQTVGEETRTRRGVSGQRVSRLKPKCP
jgi:hypothetical protein